MKKHMLFFGFLLLACAGFAQRPKVAVFAPLYLDSAFDASGNYKLDKANPRFLLSGLDFYYGVQMALDSLRQMGIPMDVSIHDSRSDEGMQRQLNSPAMNDMNLIIGQTNVSETKLLADAALRKKIPFISATLPNDAGVANNPYFVMLNPTLQAHVEGIYRYLQKYYSGQKIVVFRKNGAQENQLKGYLDDFAKASTGTAVNIKYVDLSGGITAAALLPHLDSTKKTICIAGSLEETFGKKLAQTLGGLNKKYPALLMGMPTWDNFNWTRNNLNNLEIVYTTPVYYEKGSSLESSLARRFNTEMSTRPSDMFYRGFETMLRFALLLHQSKKDIASNLTRKTDPVLSDLDIQPVFKDRAAMNLDYFENKHLYFVKVIGGNKNLMY